jgi:hypothetical protein
LSILPLMTRFDREMKPVSGRMGGGAVHVAVLAAAASVLVIGGLAIGALAVRRLAIGRAAVGRAKVAELEIGDLKVTRLQVAELAVSGSLELPPGEAPRKLTS